MRSESSNWSRYVLIPFAVGILLYQQLALWQIKQENELVRERLSVVNAASDKLEKYTAQLQEIGFHLNEEADLQKQKASARTQQLNNLEMLFESSVDNYEARPRSLIVQRINSYNNLFKTVLSSFGVAPQTTARFRKMYFPVCAEHLRKEQTGTLATSDVRTYERRE